MKSYHSWTYEGLLQLRHAREKYEYDENNRFYIKNASQGPISCKEGIGAEIY